MCNRFRRWLLSLKSPLALKAERFIYYLSRKRNSFMRNHAGTPLDWAASLNYVCVNEGKGVNLLEELALETLPQ